MFKTGWKFKSAHLTKLHCSWYPFSTLCLVEELLVGVYWFFRGPSSKDQGFSGYPNESVATQLMRLEKTANFSRPGTRLTFAFALGRSPRIKRRCIGCTSHHLPIVEVTEVTSWTAHNKVKKNTPEEGMQTFDVVQFLIISCYWGGHNLQLLRIFNLLSRRIMNSCWPGTHLTTDFWTDDPLSKGSSEGDPCFLEDFKWRQPAPTQHTVLLRKKGTSKMGCSSWSLCIRMPRCAKNLSELRGDVSGACLPRVGTDWIYMIPLSNCLLWGFVGAN